MNKCTICAAQTELAVTVTCQQNILHINVQFIRMHDAKLIGKAYHAICPNDSSHVHHPSQNVVDCDCSHLKAEASWIYSPCLQVSKQNRSVSLTDTGKDEQKYRPRVFCKDPTPPPEWDWKLGLEHSVLMTYQTWDGDWCTHTDAHIPHRIKNPTDCDLNEHAYGGSLWRRCDCVLAFTDTKHLYAHFNTLIILRWRQHIVFFKRRLCTLT